MKVTDALTYRVQDILHRILSTVSGSQSTISPVYGDSVNLPDVYYVDSGNGSDSNDGRDPGFPLATIDAAINKCTASQGDVIIVQPGHAETLTTQISLDVIGVSIIGVGEGTLKPQLTVAGVIDGIDIGAANCSVENIGFPVSTAGATSQVNIDAADAKVTKCTFHEGASDLLGTVTITASGERPTVTHNEVFVDADGPDEWVLFEGVVDRPVIDHNTIVCSDGTDGFDVAAINAVAVAVTNLVSKDNVFLGADVATAINAYAGSALVGAAIGPNEYRGNVVEGIANPFIEGLGYRVTKSGARPSGAGADDLFDVNGQCLITAIYGEVTTQIAADSDLIVNMKAAGGAVFNTLTILDGDVVQTFYSFPAPGDAMGVSGTNQAFLNSHPWICNTDTIEATWTEAGTTGAILWTLYYIPLEAGATVDAAA